MGIEQKGRKGRRKNKEFMDAVLDGYIRHESLRRWRLFAQARGHDPGRSPEALARQVGDFSERGPYAGLWARHWADRVPAAAGGPDGQVFAAVEQAVRGAVLDERAQRAERGEASLEDLPDYNAFVRRALGQLFQEASGEIEEL